MAPHDPALVLNIVAAAAAAAAAFLVLVPIVVYFVGMLAFVRFYC